MATELFGESEEATSYKIPVRIKVRGGDYHPTDSLDKTMDVIAVTFDSVDTNDEVVSETFIMPVGMADLFETEWHEVLARTKGARN